MKELKNRMRSLCLRSEYHDIRRATNGCHGCAFEKSEGARYCEMKESCMAHLRPDRTPVIFVVQ